MENKDRTVELVDSKDEEISIPTIQDEANESEHNAESSTKMRPYEDQDLDSFLDDEEDVPSDFFDDFSNQDFMAGLDVVDAWDDEDVINENEKNAAGTNASSSKKNLKGAERTRRRRSRSPDRSRYRGYNYSDRRRYLKEKYRTSRDRDRKHKSKSKEKLKDIEKKPKKSNEATVPLAQDHRRDPAKTKRDIQKDKVKCEKKKEAQIISEKLKVVETGLVPPGTEMEIDLKQLKSVTVIKESEQKTSSITVHEEKRHKSRSPDVNPVHNRVLYGKKRYSPISRRISRSPNRTYERRFSYKYNRSPYRGRSRSRSLRRRTSAERGRYVEERRRIRRYRDCSPTILKRRSKNRSSELSPISNISERELWLRQREYQRTRNVSLSPISDSDSTNRKRNRDFLEELADKLKSDRKKKSFLKEIQAQLNEPSQPRSNYSIAAPVPVPSPITGPNSLPPIHRQMHVPHPVPGAGFVPTTPQYFSPQIDPAPQYDQQFFIGQPDTFHNPSYQSYMGQLSCPGVTSNMHNEQFDGSIIPGTDALEHPIHSPINNSYTKVNVNVLQAQKIAEIQKEKDKEAITKLFEDKKISLSDFLSMCAKHADATKPVNVQKKVKVISLCQDAIKAVGGDSNLNGRFFLKKLYKEVDKPQEGKHQSPLRKIPVVRFNFTTPTKGGEDKSTLQNTLNKLLISLGLIERSASTVSKPTINSSASESAASMKISTQFQVSTPTKATARKYDPILGAKFQMKMCQTDPVKCHICEIRKSRKFVNQGVQCDINTTETGTQITDEDLQRLGLKVPFKDALRNQSLAHLTPAQLLASTMGHEELSKKDMFSSAKVITPPPPDISPEKQRISLSNNNSFLNRSDYIERYNLDSYNSQNSPNRPTAHKPPSIFDKMIPSPFGSKRPNNPFDNKSRPNPFEGSLPSRPNIFDTRPNPNMQQDQFHGSAVFSPRLHSESDFEPASDNGGPNTNQRQFFPPQRGNFLPSGQSYGGRKFF